jgi:hypothetical protein
MTRTFMGPPRRGRRKASPDRGTEKSVFLDELPEFRRHVLEVLR